MDDKTTLFYSIGLAKQGEENVVSLTVHAASGPDNTLTMNYEGCQSFLKLFLMAMDAICKEDKNHD